MPRTQITRPEIYVACLSSYNNGHLHGAWIDATLDPDSIKEAIQEMLAESPMDDAEEWEIHDTQGFGEALHSRHYFDLHHISDLANAILEHGEAFILYTEYMGEVNVELFQDMYQGSYKSEEEFAQWLHDELGDIPEHLEYYIDWERVARDLFINDYFSAEGDTCIHVFCRH